jgi:CMP-2-keto-3-deoxyoctulosonic acid synthetase
MQNGVRIAVERCVEAPGPGVDTQQDLEHARVRVAARGAGSEGGRQ